MLQHAPTRLLELEVVIKSKPLRTWVFFKYSTGGGIEHDEYMLYEILWFLNLWSRWSRDKIIFQHYENCRFQELASTVGLEEDIYPGGLYKGSHPPCWIKTSVSSGVKISSVMNKFFQIQILGFVFFFPENIRRQQACISFLIHVATDPFVRKELRHTSCIFCSMKEARPFITQHDTPFRNSPLA